MFIITIYYGHVTFEHWSSTIHEPLLNIHESVYVSEYICEHLMNIHEIQLTSAHVDLVCAGVMTMLVITKKAFVCCWTG